MNRKRYKLLDGIRGFALIHMIIYHAIWDLVYIAGFDWQWYQTETGYIWQQAICQTFICLSGFCVPLGRRRLQRGCTVFLAGLMISAVTIMAMPDNRVVCGILTLTGSCMLLMIPLERILIHFRPQAGLAVCIILFIFTRNINQGWLGAGSLKLLELPQKWYYNLFTAWLGMPAPDFFSTDYFSLFPWMFLFTAGYFLYRLFSTNGLLHYLEHGVLKPFEWLGQHSLGIYMIHQPVLYAMLLLFFL